jgi:hypothetical protein
MCHQIEIAPSTALLKTYFERIHLNIRSALDTVPRLRQTMKVVDDMVRPTSYAQALADDPRNCNLQTNVVQGAYPLVIGIYTICFLSREVKDRFKRRIWGFISEGDAKFCEKKI